MREKIDLKNIATDLDKMIIDFFPYFLFFYFFVLAVAIFSRSWRSFVYWPGLNILATIYAVYYFIKILSAQRKKIVHPSDRLTGARLTFFQLLKDLAFRMYIALKVISKVLRALFFWLRAKIVRFSRKDWLKIFLIAVILIFAVWRRVAFIDFFILAYGLSSFLFIYNSRISAGIALAFLVFCPILLLFKKEGLAEDAAIYAYYFLIITVLTQIRELKREDRMKNNFVSSKINR
jgi:hypothetical protein